MKMKIINDKLFFYVDSAMKIADFFAYYYLSKKTIHDLLTNRLLVNHNQVNNDYMLRKGDVISVDIAKTIDKKVSGNLCDVIYEDDIVLIVKKGDDQIIHDDQSDNALENDVATYYQYHDYHRNVRYIHRLDKRTSGLVFFCKVDFFISYFDHLLSDKKIHREYLAIVKGKFKDCIVDKKIGSDRHVNNKYRISDTGKEAKTAFKLISYKNGYSLVNCTLFTGRTHQIRVHLQSIGDPIINDEIYGFHNDRFKLMGLYAYKLSFIDVIKKVPLTISDTSFEDLDYFKVF